MYILRYQHPVGQGCFHTGIISGNCFRRSSTDDICYVYDCGALDQKVLRSEIGLLSGEYSSIDALFLSHLDYDHVSGLDYLLAKIKVQTVYIPYIDNILLILDLLESEKDEFLSASLIEASLEPESWFGRRGVQRVVRVLGAPDLPPEGRSIPEPDGPRDGMIEDREPLTLKAHPSPPRRIRVGTPGKQSELLHMSPSDSICVMRGQDIVDWMLVPFVDPAPPERRRAFGKALKTVLGLAPRKALSMARLADGLRDRKWRGEIRGCYDEIIANGARRMHNRVSMSLYSGPTGRRRSQQLRYFAKFGKSNTCSTRQARSPGVGWLATGDATLNVNRVRDRWRQAYAPICREVGTLVLPHHGSHHNFHHEILDFPNLKLCVASAADPSPYEHPSRRVIKQIQDSSLIFCQVSQYQDSILAEWVTGIQ